MYGLNAFSIIIFAIFNVSAVQLCKCEEKTRLKLMRVLCVSLLGLNVFRYALSPILGNGIKVPVEFSAVAYFSVPVMLLTGRKGSWSWAAYSGLMAGFFYYMTMLVSGGKIYNDYPPYSIYISMFCHGSLYLCGLVTIGTQPCSSKDGYKLMLGLGFVAARAIVLRPLAYGTERLFIYELIDAAWIKQLLSQELWGVAIPIYYAVMLGLLLVTVRGFFSLSQSQYNRFSKQRQLAA